MQFYAFDFSGTPTPHINGPTARSQDGRVSSVTPTDMLQNSGFLRSLTTEDFELKIPVTFPEQKTWRKLMSGLQGFEKSNIQSSLSSDMTEKFQWKEHINPSPDEGRKKEMEHF